MTTTNKTTGRKSWTDKDKQTLSLMAANGYTIKTIAKKLQRSAASVKHAAKLYGVGINSEYQNRRDLTESLIINLASKGLSPMDIQKEVLGLCVVGVSIPTIYKILNDNNIKPYSENRKEIVRELILKYNRLIGSSRIIKLVKSRYISVDVPNASVWVPKELLHVYKTRFDDVERVANFMNRTVTAIYNIRARYFSGVYKLNKSTVLGWLSNHDLRYYKSIKGIDPKFLGAVIIYCYENNIELPDMEYGKPLYEICADDYIRNLKADLESSGIDYNKMVFESIVDEFASSGFDAAKTVESNIIEYDSAVEVDDQSDDSKILVVNDDGTCYIEQTLTGSEVLNNVLISDTQKVTLDGGAFKLITTIKPGEKHTL